MPCIFGCEINREDEQQLDFAGAENDWKKHVELATNKTAAGLSLADFYHRRLRPQDEIAALEIVAENPQVRNPVAMTFDADGNLYVLERDPTDRPAQEEFLIRTYKDGSKRKVSLLGNGYYSKDSEIKDGYPEFTLGVLKKLGWDKDLTAQELATIRRVNEKNPDAVSWATDLSGGIQRVAIKHGCSPYGNAKARNTRKIWRKPNCIWKNMPHASSKRRKPRISTTTGCRRWSRHGARRNSRLPSRAAGSCRRSSR